MQVLLVYDKGDIECRVESGSVVKNARFTIPRLSEAEDMLTEGDASRLAVMLASASTGLFRQAGFEMNILCGVQENPQRGS